MAKDLLFICAFTNTGYCWLMYSPNFACLLQEEYRAYLKAHSLTVEKAHTEMNVGWGGCLTADVRDANDALMHVKDHHVKDNNNNKNPPDHAGKELYILDTFITLYFLAVSSSPSIFLCLARSFFPHLPPHTLQALPLFFTWQITSRPAFILAEAEFCC